MPMTEYETNAITAMNKAATAAQTAADAASKTAAAIQPAEARDERRVKALEDQASGLAKNTEQLKAMVAVAGEGMSRQTARYGLLCYLTPNYMKPSTATTPEGQAADAARDAAFLRAAFNAAWPLWEENLFNPNVLASDGRLPL